MTINYVWRVRWKYADSSGKLLALQEQAADFIINPQAPAPGGDGTVRPDMNDARTRVSNNFGSPPGATIVFIGVNSSQTPAAYS